MITLNKYEQGLADLLEKATPDQIAVIKIPSETNPGYVQSILDEKLFVDIPQLKTQVYEYTPPGYVGHKFRGRDEVVPDVDKKYSFLVYVDDLFECGFTIARGAKVLAEE